MRRPHKHRHTVFNMAAASNYREVLLRMKERVDRMSDEILELLMKPEAQELEDLRDENRALKMQLRDFQQQEMDRLAFRRNQNLRKQQQQLQQRGSHSISVDSRGWIECDEVDH